MSGQLFVVPTPIGNLKDITFRAIDVLKSVNFIVAEDTRTSSILLKHYDIQTPLTPYHMHNEHKVTQHIISQIQAGVDVALISDAGTPGISDPGHILIKAAIVAHIKVECLPGATALIPALVMSGFSTTAFSFYGFLPLKKGRQTQLKYLSEKPETMLLYESPMRLLRTLQDLGNYMGEDRIVCVCREISKKFEEIVRGTITEVKKRFEQKQPKGEMVIVIQGKEKLKESSKD